MRCQFSYLVASDAVNDLEERAVEWLWHGDAAVRVEREPRVLAHPLQFHRVRSLCALANLL